MAGKPQAALDDCDAVSPRLAAIDDALNAGGRSGAAPLDINALSVPLLRTRADISRGAIPCYSGRHRAKMIALKV